MDATPDKVVHYGFEGEVGVGQRNTVNNSCVGSVNSLCLRDGRGARIRTGGPLHPMQVRYLAALRPDIRRIVYPIFPHKVRISSAS